MAKFVVKGIQSKMLEIIVEAESAEQAKEKALMFDECFSNMWVEDFESYNFEICDVEIEESEEEDDDEKSSC